MQASVERASGRSAEGVRAAIEAFLKTARQPALLEPGESLLPLTGDNYSLEFRSSRLTLQAWDRTRNLVRRIVSIADTASGRLELVVERFARKPGQLFLLDLARPAAHDAARRSTRLVFREQFRQFLGREFAGWKIAELTTEPNLEHSLSPAYPRAMLTEGQRAKAAIAAPPGGDTAGILSFGLIWLDYLRRRERRRTIESLVLFLPAAEERSTCLRVAWLNPEAVRCELFVYAPNGFAARIDPRDFGNLETHLDPCRRPVARDFPEIEGLLAVPGVERVPTHDGAVSLRVRGIEFARAGEGGLKFGLSDRRAAQRHHFAEIEQLAREVAASRSPHSPNRLHPLYLQAPERWLESLVRAQIETIDAALLTDPIYGQVPAFAAGERGVIDLLAAERNGRLAVLELKASQDIHLPLQALDYWMRVKWHLDRGEFEACGYFPGYALRAETPRLLLVSPSLDFHPANEVILGFFAPVVPVERIGVGVEWRKRLEVMFRLC